MKRLMAALMGLLALMMAAGASAAETTSMIDSGWPPEQFMGDTQVPVIFTSNVEDICGEADPGYVVLGCAIGNLIILPNPCLVASYREEGFARLVCHEMGHTSGWPGNHPRQ